MILFNQCRSATRFRESTKYKIEITRETDQRVVARGFCNLDNVWQIWQRACQWQRANGVLGEATLTCESQIIRRQYLSLPTAQSTNQKEIGKRLQYQSKRVCRALKF